MKSACVVVPAHWTWPSPCPDFHWCCWLWTVCDCSGTLPTSQHAWKAFKVWCLVGKTGQKSVIQILNPWRQTHQLVEKGGKLTGKTLWIRDRAASLPIHLLAHLDTTTYMLYIPKLAIYIYIYINHQFLWRRVNGFIIFYRFKISICDFGYNEDIYSGNVLLGPTLINLFLFIPRIVQFPGEKI